MTLWVSSLAIVSLLALANAAATDQDITCGYSLSNAAKQDDSDQFPCGIQIPSSEHRFRFVRQRSGNNLAESLLDDINGWKSCRFGGFAQIHESRDKTLLSARNAENAITFYEFINPIENSAPTLTQICADGLLFDCSHESDETRLRLLNLLKDEISFKTGNWITDPKMIVKTVEMLAFFACVPDRLCGQGFIGRLEKQPHCIDELFKIVLEIKRLLADDIDFITFPLFIEAVHRMEDDCDRNLLNEFLPNLSNWMVSSEEQQRWLRWAFFSIFPKINASSPNMQFYICLCSALLDKFSSLSFQTKLIFGQEQPNAPQEKVTFMVGVVSMLLHMKCSSSALPLIQRIVDRTPSSLLHENVHHFSRSYSTLFLLVAFASNNLPTNPITDSESVATIAYGIIRRSCGEQIAEDEWIGILHGLCSLSGGKCSAGDGCVRRRLCTSCRCQIWASAHNDFMALIARSQATQPSSS